MIAERDAQGEPDRVRQMRTDIIAILGSALPRPEAAQLTERVLSAILLPRENIRVSRLQVIRWRDDAVRREFNGRNYTDVMRRYHISLPTLYRVLRQNSRGSKILITPREMKQPSR